MEKVSHSFQSNRRLVISMWRAVFLLFFTADYYRLIQFTSAIDSNFYSEGGSFLSPYQRNTKPRWQPSTLNELNGALAAEENEHVGNHYLQRQLDDVVNEEDQPESEANYQNNRLEKIVTILAKEPSVHDYEFAYPQAGNNQNINKDSSYNSELSELESFGKKIKQLESAESPRQAYIELPEYDQSDSNEFGEQVLTTQERKEMPLTAQKKGQSEFVEFVEPHDTLSNKVLKNIEFLNKRAPANLYSSENGRHALSFISASGNVVFLAFVTMCCVISVVGVVGGMYYYNHSRVTRDDPFDDFTRYSPAGPGRDRLKKNEGNGRGIFGGNNGTISSIGAGEKGDDALAYKAQLHHYQQTKQKIIGADSDAINAQRQTADACEKSDDEDDADLEHNFSVYECPGLAQTGDIEVRNPNFVDSTPK